MTPTLTIIPPNPNDHAEAIYALLDKVWQGSGPTYRDGRIAHSHYDWQSARVGLVGDTLATHYAVYDMTVRIGTARVRSGGVNIIATDPDYRKRGFMHQTALSCMHAMRANGYDISVICNGISDFYHRYGYVFAWPEMSYEIDGEHIPKLKRDIALESIELQHQGAQLLAETSALYNAENAMVTGSVVRPTYLRGKVPGNGDMLYYWRDVDGQLAGYLMGDVHMGMNRFYQEDCAGNPAEILSVWAMLLEQTGCEGIYIDRLGERTALGKQLKQLTCKKYACYKKNGGFMVTIINLKSLFEKLVPELSRRIQQSLAANWVGHLSITCKDEIVTLAIKNGQVEVVPTAVTEHTMVGGDEMAQLVMGTDTPNDIVERANINLSGDAARLISILFPKQDPQMSNCDL